MLPELIKIFKVTDQVHYQLYFLNKVPREMIVKMLPLYFKYDTFEVSDLKAAIKFYFEELRPFDYDK